MKTILIILLSLTLISCSQRVYVNKGYSGKIICVCNNGYSKAIYFDDFEVCNYQGNAAVGDSVTLIYYTDRWGQNNFKTQLK